VVKSHINEAKIKAEMYADKDTNIKTFKIGKFYLQDEMLRRGRSKKLEAPWTSPYRVEKILDVNYKIQIKRKIVCVHGKPIKTVRRKLRKH